MVDRGDIRAGMQVLGSDGGMVGRVTGLHGDHIHIEPDAPEPGGDRLIPNHWVARIDNHVHLDREAALVRDTWETAEKSGAASPFVHEAAHKGVGRSWVVWLIGAILLLVIIVIGVRGCVYGVTDPEYGDATSGALTEADRAASGAAAAEAAENGLDDEVQLYLASDEPAPRNFPMRDLRFNDGSAELASENREDLAALGRVLAAHPDVRVRVNGGIEGEIAEALAERRAEAISAALVANGVRPENIETAIGEAGNEVVILER